MEDSQSKQTRNTKPEFGVSTKANHDGVMALHKQIYINQPFDLTIKLGTKIVEAEMKLAK